MVAQGTSDPMSVEEYYRLVRTEPDVKYEYIDGSVYLMSGGTFDHAHIAQTIVGLLEDAGERRSCRAYNSDVRVRVSETRYFFPDASVTCDEHDQGTGDEVQTPRLVVEVLSPSTEAYDRGRKSAYYRACSSIDEYLLIASDRLAVEVYRRTNGHWTLFEYGAEETVEIQSVDLYIPVLDLYRHTSLERAR